MNKNVTASILLFIVGIINFLPVMAVVSADRLPWSAMYSPRVINFVPE